jgi:glycosyltransferase involved in cell wall biosynthesis
MHSISVVIPLYNHAFSIGVTLESVLRQTSATDEIIMFDDGSADDGAARAEKELARVARARMIRQCDNGADAAINRLIQISASDFIAVLSSDDVIRRGKLARCRELIARRADIKFICGRLTVIEENGVRLTSGAAVDWPARAEEYRACCRGPRLSLMNENYVTTTTNMMFSRALWRISGGFQPLRLCHDLDFLITVFRHGRITAVLSCALQNGIAGLAQDGDFRPVGDMLGKNVSHLYDRFESKLRERLNAPALLG